MDLSFAMLGGACLLFASSTLASAAPAQFCDAELNPTAPEVSAQFGSAVSMGGSFTAVGSPFASGGLPSPGTNGAGSVSIYEQGASGWMLAATLTSPNPEASGQFGYDVAISDDYLIVGAPFEDSGQLDSGRAYLYQRSGNAWLLVDTILELSQSVRSRFGHSVDLEGNQLVVSAIRSAFFGPDAGAVYFYGLGGGQAIFQDRVGPSPVSPGGFFGTSVALSDGRCAVGAVFEALLADDEGAAYVFERQPNMTWNQYSKVVPPVSQENAFFGISVDLDGIFLMVGAEGINNGAPSGVSGTVFLFTDLGGGFLNPDSQLASPMPVGNGNFGRAVTISGDRLIVSELGNGGVAHEYRAYSGPGGPWAYSSSIRGIGHTDSDSFATDVSLQGDRLVVGAPARTTAVPVAGAAFVYDLEFEDCNGNGLSDQCEVDSDPSLDCDANGLLDSCELMAGTGSDCNGNSVLDVCDVTSGTSMDINGNLTPDECEEAGVPTGCQTIPNSTGMLGTLVAVGTEDAVANDIVLVGGSMPLNTFGYPVVSTMPNQVIPPGAAGFLCIGGAVGRDYSNIFNTMGSGGATLPLDLRAIPAPNGTLSAGVGETWYWQLWHRDLFGGQLVSTFTDSIAFSF